MRTQLNRIGFLLKFLALPDFCFYCRIYLAAIAKGKKKLSDSFLCSSCATRIKPIISYQLRLASNYTIPIYAVSAYEEPLRSLILAKKWSCIGAAEQLADIIWDYSVAPSIAFDYIIPVPAHWMRTAHRGYNQAAVIAQKLSQLSGKPLINAVIRKRRTRFQAECKNHERARNVADAFELTDTAALLEGSKILIVDDLMTTGATLYNMGKELIKMHPQALFGIVACRVL